ncbi:MAG: type 1 glutamine amidotransferase [Pseudomonadota bacterium]|nr:type 1 glutamine amidotransferase [Pseudomonadota bacterium]
MKIHYLMHVPFEGLGGIEPCLVGRGFALSRTRLFAAQRLPEPGSVDGLIVMGGPMSVGDAGPYSWLLEEKRFIAKVLHSGKPVLGICLGAQLLADVLGVRVYRNREKEIGWFPVALTPDGRSSPFFRGFPPEFDAFHWHGDTFDIPAGAFGIGFSEACDNQGFVLDNAVALQFHLESQPSGVMDLCSECADELVPAPFVQTPEKMLVDPGRFSTLQDLNRTLLGNLFVPDDPVIGDIPREAT